jgi:hypothetical protein
MLKPFQGIVAVLDKIQEYKNTKTMIKPINKLQIWDRPESAQNVIHNS